jgi:predicted nucleotidyltransferase
MGSGIEMKKTGSPTEAIKTFLEMAPGIRYAFIYGSLLKRPRSPEGEVDAMVVGKPDLVEMDQIILKAEEELKRAISLMSFTVREFRERVKVKDRLVSKALNRTKIMLIGDEREMGRLLA